MAYISPTKHLAAHPVATYLVQCIINIPHSRIVFVISVLHTVKPFYTLKVKMFNKSGKKCAINLDTVYIMMQSGKTLHIQVLNTL